MACTEQEDAAHVLALLRELKAKGRFTSDTAAKKSAVDSVIATLTDKSKKV